MSFNIKTQIKPNTIQFETQALIKPTGFREYDARWWFGIQGHEKDPELNLYGVQALGEGLGTLIYERGVEPKIVVGHDFRYYSLSIKQALIVGLMNAGVKVLDIGLALSPMAYFAQFHLNAAAVAMVTASHNDNGWTGVKMGIEAPLTFGPEEMAHLKDIVLKSQSKSKAGGSYKFINGVKDAYISDLVEGVKLKNKIKVVAACGNGTAGAFVEETLKAIGADVIPVECNLDYNFPNYNPNPEDMKMLHEMSKASQKHQADVTLGFDGDGDRCGVVDNEGKEIFADKVGVMLARDLVKTYPNAKFVVDVKSTGLYHTDPELVNSGATVDYYKTGHSYIKRRTKNLNALVGFEKSGHYFFNAPIGRGYDCGLTSAIAILQMLDRNIHKTMADLYRELPKTWGSPTMSPYCSDEEKYYVVDAITDEYKKAFNNKEKICGLSIASLITVNGIRITLEDGTWGLVRASSNSPNLVVVVESPTSEEYKISMFHEIETRLSKYSQVGDYNQKV